jgi:hypothetical protein
VSATASLGGSKGIRGVIRVRLPIDRIGSGFTSSCACALLKAARANVPLQPARRHSYGDRGPALRGSTADAAYSHTRQKHFVEQVFRVRRHDGRGGTGTVFGHATATCLIGGVTAAQRGGTDNAPIEEARPRPADNTGAAPLPAPRSAEPNDVNARVPEPPGTASAARCAD